MTGLVSSLMVDIGDLTLMDMNRMWCMVSRKTQNSINEYVRISITLSKWYVWNPLHFCSNLVTVIVKTDDLKNIQNYLERIHSIMMTRKEKIGEMENWITDLHLLSLMPLLVKSGRLLRKYRAVLLFNKVHLLLQHELQSRIKLVSVNFVASIRECIAPNHIYSNLSMTNK